MLSSAEAIVSAYAKALLVDRAALHDAQQSNDVMMAFQALRQAYNADVSPILARVRLRAEGAIEVLSTFRASGYREKKAGERRNLAPGTGIV
jgi:L-rhamnose isomerase/sugar isomerase